MPSPSRQKHLGAFYTPPIIARKLIDWAVRSPSDRVLDPSFGGLVFFDAAAMRLHQLGASRVADQLYGVDIDEAAFARVADSRYADAQLVRRDFFRCAPDGRILPRVEAVVGNPPYVRYQAFKTTRERGERVVARHNINLTRLASSWAPFLVHGVDFVASGGRLAQVLPAELIHAQYADELLGYICRQFRRVVVAMFHEAVFPGAQEEVVLLLAEDKGGGPSPGVEVVASRNVIELDVPPTPGRAIVVDAEHKLLVGLLDESTVAVYDELRAGEHTCRLGDLASVDIGAVTGANDFFLVDPDTATKLPDELLRPAISKAAHIPGALLQAADLALMQERGLPSRMLVIDATSPHAERASVRELLAAGVRARVHERYKCRIRDPWWSLPASQVRTPELFLTYMASDVPRLVVNAAGAMSTNTVHGVTLTNGADPSALVAGFYNSLTLLSAELVGRSYGGGVLKLEPTEAERLVLPHVTKRDPQLLERVDSLLRRRSHDDLVSTVDKAILMGQLGLDPAVVSRLRTAGELLRSRRRSRAGRSTATP